MAQITHTTAIVEDAVEIDLNATARSAVVGYLNVVLADEVLLATKTRNYHWNVTGANFASLHQFFGSQYEQLDEAVDEIAERIRVIGGKPVATLPEFVSLARIKEDGGQTPSAKEMVARLLADQESVIRTIRTDLVSITKLGDAGTVEFLTGLLESQEKMAWMLRATVPTPQIKA
ncbi:MAG TPA: DNA starvation/stationary phase protection protein [Candidatus Thermoplasmatota archaeon]